MDEVNLVRSNPKTYFETYIEDKKDWWNQEFNDPSKHEGYSSLSTTMKALTSDLGQLTWKNGLFQCSKAHSTTQGKTKQTGHDRTDGTTWNNAIAKYGTGAPCGENISYGMETARDIVIQLLLDDDVSSRGHRNNILNNGFTDFGASFDTHVQYRYMCVQNFGTNWVDSNN